MFKCYEGHLFDEPKRLKEEHGEFVYECPECGDSFEEAKRCVFCGEWCRPGELYDGVCEECIHEYDYDWQTCWRFADKENLKEDIEINSILATLFTAEDIEQILFEHLTKITKPCTGSAAEKDFIRRMTDCSEFIDEDKYWFAGMILYEDVERRKKLYVR